MISKIRDMKPESHTNKITVIYPISNPASFESDSFHFDMPSAIHSEDIQFA